MKTQVTLIARNAQGGSVEFFGASKKEAMENFKFEYGEKGWKFEYRNEYGEII